jgi:hypothetical protein
MFSLPAVQGKTMGKCSRHFRQSAMPRVIARRLTTMTTSPPGQARTPAVRCYTRALKNARHLQAVAPEVFARDPDAEGFGTGVPLEILRGLHRMAYHSPALNRYQAVAEVLRTNPPPVPGRAARAATSTRPTTFSAPTRPRLPGDSRSPTSRARSCSQRARPTALRPRRTASTRRQCTPSRNPVLTSYDDHRPYAPCRA